jgi:transcriptional regulator of acetoin/glycerol metabolism
MADARYEEQRLTLKAWDRAIVRGTPVSGEVKLDVSQSWQRCVAARLNPGLPRAPIALDDDALRARRELPWFRLAEAVLAPHIEAVAGCGHVLTLFDADGCMLSSAGDPGTLEILREIQFMPGANWRESVAGTNGPGTALALRRPIHVIGAEHYCEAWHPWHCAAVPLFDPLTRELLGALDISGDERTAHPYALALATALARSIEQAMLLESQTRAAREVVHSASRPPRRLQPSAATRYDFDDLIGAHPSLQEARRLAQLASRNRLPVLLLGESGVGKEVVAQAIHNASLRAQRPFVAVNCGAIPTELIESELFGYVRGAFSGAQRAGAKGKFEAADGGTLFLDEICDLPMPAQAALLRALQEHQITRVGANQPTFVDVRIIAATHRDPRAEVEAKTFRSDLFYRLNVLAITVPPLRARASDVVMLARRFLVAAERETGRSVVLAPEVEQALMRYAWPGNVRELENLILRVAATSRGEVVTLEDLPEELRAVGGVEAVSGGGSEDPRKLELIAVVRGARTMAEAAERLGITRSTLYRRMTRFGLQPARWVGGRE